jgi:hypothetical protein
MAATGLALMYPASVMGRHLKSDGTPHHVTVKFFDRPDVTPDRAHEFADQQDLRALNPHQILVEPKKFKTRFGGTVHVLALRGPGIDHVKTANTNGSDLGQPTHYDFQPHITVDSDVFDHVAGMGPNLKASDLGIKFGAAELRHGPRTLNSYDNKPSGIAKSEATSDLQKGNFSRHAAVAAGLMGLLGSPQVTSTAQAKTPISSQSQHADKGKALRAIASVESSGGKNTHHEALTGKMHGGESAYGRYGLTPVIIRETIKKHPDLRQKYGGAADMRGKEIQDFMAANPKLEDTIASRHYDRLSKVLGGNLNHISMAWLNGIAGTMRFIKTGGDTSKHWHVKKVQNAYKAIESAKDANNPAKPKQFPVKNNLK